MRSNYIKKKTNSFKKFHKNRRDLPYFSISHIRVEYRANSLTAFNLKDRENARVIGARKRKGQDWIEIDSINRFGWNIMERRYIIVMQMYYIARSKDQTTPFHPLPQRSENREARSIIQPLPATISQLPFWLIDRHLTRLFIQSVVNHSHNNRGNFGANFGKSR